jgi:response regulator RpfG family c-di-GMP phosphodiesterase
MIAPVLQHADDRIAKLLQAPIWRHKDNAHGMVRDRWLQHGRDEAAIASLYFLRYPGELPTDAVLDDVVLGLMIHDIGKPEVSDDPSIWRRRREELSPAELSALQSHVDTAKALLVRYEDVTGEALSPTVWDIVLQHHEKLDGSGNPNHLSGNAISKAGRLAGVIDQIVSRCEPRAYHDRVYTLREAFEETEQGADTLYDGQILRNLRKTFENNDHMEVPRLTWLGAWNAYRV